MKTTLIALLLTFTLSAFAKESSTVKPSTNDIYTQVRDIMR
ncbi:MAG: hypothetical protein V4598_05450 [Bdellovibrionota bacterium]